jgi:hypothetical protein
MSRSRVPAPVLLIAEAELIVGEPVSAEGVPS